MTRETNKLDAFLRLAASGPVQVHLNPRVQGVVVPDGLRAQFRLALDFGLDRGARDLRADAWGLRETLLFSARGIAIAVPWEAVFWMRQLKGEAFFSYPFSVPPEVAGSPDAIEPDPPSPLPPRPPEAELRPKLRLVTDDD